MTPAALFAPETIWSAPGRVNLIGEHTDYNDGFVLPFALDLRVRVAAARRADGRVVASSAQAPGEDGEALVAALDPAAAARGWLAYPFGVVWALRALGPVCGVDLVVDGVVPAGSGLSSSAALECAVACAVAELSRLALSPVEIALACRRAENDYVGVPSGAMDQLAAMCCTAGHALFLDTRTLAMEQVPLDPAAAGCVLLVIDTGHPHSLTSRSYADRRRSCEEAARRLGVRALRDVAEPELGAALAALGDEVLAGCARHVVTENARVLEAVHLLSAGRLRELGPLLHASHASLRDDLEVSAPLLDLAAETAEDAGCLGARMVGGGFGGSVLVLADAAAEAVIREAVTAAFARRGFEAPAVVEVVPSDAARREDVAELAPRG